MSAKLPLPKAVFGHGFLLNRGVKESKTLGNVTDPMALSQQFGTDTLRYFLMREVAFGQTVHYSPEAIVTRCNAELANSFGNLAQRSLSMIYKNMDGFLEPALYAESADRELRKFVEDRCGMLIEDFDALAFSDGLENWMQAVFACNQYIDDQAPWTLKKTDDPRMRQVLMTLFQQVPRSGDCRTSRHSGCMCVVARSDESARRQTDLRDDPADPTGSTRW